MDYNGLSFPSRIILNTSDSKQTDTIINSIKDKEVSGFSEKDPGQQDKKIIEWVNIQTGKPILLEDFQSQIESAE